MAKEPYISFRFADPISVIGPSAHDERIAGLMTMALGLLAFIAALMVIGFFLTERLMAVADIEPYVADGGIYGCKVPEWDGKHRL